MNNTKLDRMIRNEAEYRLTDLAIRRDARLAGLTPVGMCVGVIIEDQWYNGTDRWCPVVTNEEAVQSGIKWGVLPPRNISDGPYGSYVIRANSRLNERFRPCLLRRISFGYGLLNFIHPNDATPDTMAEWVGYAICGAYCIAVYRYAVGGYRNGNPPDLIIRRVAAWRASNPEIGLTVRTTRVLKNIVRLVWGDQLVYLARYGGRVINWISEAGLITSEERETMISYVREVRAELRPQSIVVAA